ncbi:MAG: hypothetical protein RID07_09000, partial [Lacipirellulaceae bacterium]
GCTATRTHQDNTTSAKYFNQSIILLGLLLIPFFLAMPSMLEEGQQIVRSAGVLSAGGLIGLGLTPYDQQLVGHLASLGLWLLSTLLLVVMLFYLLGSRLNGFSRIVSTIATLAVIFAACGYLFIGTPSGHVLFQKLVVIVVAGWFCLLLLVVSVTTVEAVLPHKLLIEQQARDYLEHISTHSHRRVKYRKRR